MTAAEEYGELPPIEAYADETRAGPLAHGRQPTTTPPLRLLSLDEFTVRPHVSWLVRDLIPAQSIVVVFAAPKSGKTYVVTDIAMHGAHGMHWHGHTISRPLRVAYLAGEGHMGLRVRFRVWQQHHETEMRGAMAVLPHALGLPERVADVVAMLREYQPDIVIADTLNAYFGGGDENSTRDMTTFTDAVRAIRDGLQCSVIVVHHTGLTAQDRGRGSSVLYGTADVMVQVARDEDGSGRIGVQVVEARDMERWAEPLALRLERVDSDWLDDEGQPIAACVVMSSDVPIALPGRRERPLGDHAASLLDVIREMATSRGKGAAEIMLARHEVSDLAQQRGMDRRRVSESWTPLARRKLIRLVEPGSIIVRCSP